MDALFAASVAFAAIVCALAAVALRNWMRLARDPESFRCRVARTRRRRRGVRWSRFRTRACWVSDVLLIQVGLLRLRTRAVHVVLPADARIAAESTDDVRGLGPRPESLTMESDRGPSLRVAVAHAERTRLAGPFLAAAITGMSGAPREDRRSGR